MDDDYSDTSEKNQGEFRACRPNHAFYSVIGRRKYMKFRQLYELEKPKGVKEPKYFFKMINNISIVKWTLEDNGFVEGKGEKQEPCFIWCSGMPPINTFHNLNRFQKINHFPSSNQLTRKDYLYKNLHKLACKFGRNNFDFLPQSYILP